MKIDLETDTFKEMLRSELTAAGAVAVGFAKAEAVDEGTRADFQAWLDNGCNGALRYMHNYPELRFDPRGLLPGAATVVSVAWPYLPPHLRAPSLPFIARYAYAPDYHKSIRRILKPILKRWQSDYDLNTRVCVDSAPVLERYWAVKAGVGFTGLNGCLIVPGYGSWVFLTEILLDTELYPDAPCTHDCGNCGACLKACPVSALRGDGTVDCRLCRSALTIETPRSANSDLTSTTDLIPDSTSNRDSVSAKNDWPLVGCDRCQEICPHNRDAVPHNIPAFDTVPDILTLDAEDILTMTPADFDRRFARTSLSRLGLPALRHNLLTQLSKRP